MTAASAGTETAAARRVPSQERSRALVDRVLAAAGEVVDAEGPAAATVQAIAKRAGVATGSLYQYFDSRDGVLEALVLSHVAAFEEVLNRLFAERSFTRIADAVAGTLGAYVTYYRTEPGFRALWLEQPLPPNLLAADKANNAVLAARLAELYSPLMGRPAADLQSAFEVAVEIGDALLDLAFRRDPEGDEAVVAEAQLIITAHLERHAH